MKLCTKNYNFLILVFLLAALVSCSGGRFRDLDYETVKHQWAENLENNRAKYPSNFPWKHPEKRVFYQSYFVAYLFSAEFAQGDAVYLELIPTADVEEFKVFYNNKEIRLSQSSWGYKGLFGIHPDQKPGTVNLKITHEEMMQTKELTISFDVKDRRFPVSKTLLKLGKFSDISELRKPEVQEFIKKCIEKKKEAFSKSGENLITSNLFHPLKSHIVTSKFWAKRMKYRYDKRKKKRVHAKSSKHTGLDLAGKNGTPIYAIADGKILLAEEMYYEGYYTLIDHGNDIFSGYMHQHRINVHEGDTVEAGEKIGEVGASGAVTGPHLHIFLKIQGVIVDPMSLLVLPYRE